jgi:hypothetical protein
MSQVGHVGIVRQRRHQPSGAFDQDAIAAIRPRGEARAKQARIDFLTFGPRGQVRRERSAKDLGTNLLEIARPARGVP